MRDRHGIHGSTTIPPDHLTAYHRVGLPVVIAIALPITIGWHAAAAYGLAWGLVPAVFCGLVPHVLNERVKRSGQDDGREGKPLALLLGAALSLATGSVVLLAGSAPRAVLASACALLGILVALFIARAMARALGPRDLRANFSVHGASAGGAASVCLVTFGPAVGVIACLCAAAVAWSRVRVHRRTNGHDGHTPVEAVIGVLLGAAAAGLVFRAMI